METGMCKSKFFQKTVNQVSKKRHKEKKKKNLTIALKFTAKTRKYAIFWSLIKFLFKLGKQKWVYIVVYIDVK